MLGSFRRSIGWLGLSALLVLCLPAQGWALDVNISARYRGDPNGQFENTTPVGAFCKYAWVNCNPLWYTADVPITYTKVAVHPASEARDRFYMKLPEPRTIEVMNERGQLYRVNMALTYVSMRSTLHAGVRHPIVAAREGCSYQASSDASPRYPMSVLWRVENARLPCSVYGNYSADTALTDIDDLGVAVSLVVPPPTGMATGIYRGSVTFTVGAAGEWDFGNNVTNLNTSSVTFNLELEVDHDLFLKFPANSERAVLEPPGGWRNWLAGRGAPNRLYRDLPFQISSSGPFRVYKLCQYDEGTECAIREGDGHQVPVNVALTLPGGMAVGGRPVERMPIPTGEGAALVISALAVVLDRPAALHFEVTEAQLPAMMLRPGRRYEGLVTVLFDAFL